MATPGPVGVIGRGEEIAALEAFTASLDNAPATLLLTGEPGIGKTTLWRLGVDAAEDRSLIVLETSPTEAESTLSFAALGDLLDQVLEEVLARLPVPQRRALEVALLLRPDEGTPPDQRAVGMAVLNVLRALARSQPVLLAVDDIQWLDASSASVLVFALRRLKAEPVLLLLAHRSEGDDLISLGLDKAFTANRLQHLRVGPLTLGALNWLLRDRLGTAFSRPLLRRLHEISVGNPFYALELGRALTGLEGGVEPGHPLPVPAELTELIGARLVALPAGTREALIVAAALSQPTLGLISAGLGVDAVKVLRPAVEARVVEISGGRVRFTHPLLASAAYELASFTRRREIHKTLAGIVDDVEERAHHLAQTTEVADEEIAQALEEAAHRASSRGAQDTAADLAARARLLTPGDDSSAIRRRSLLEAEYALESGDTPRARAVLEESLASIPAGPARAELLTTLGRVHFNGLDWRKSIDLLERALGEVGNDLHLRGQIELHLAINLDLLRTKVTETAEHAREAVKIAEEIGDDTLLAEALVLLAKSELLLGGEWPNELVERALLLEPATRALPADRWVSDYVASMRGWTDDLNGAITTLETVAAISLERGDEVSLIWALARCGDLKCHVGRWEDALRDIEQGSEIALQAGQTANQAIFLALSALVKAHLGWTKDALVAAEDALELAETAGTTMARRTALAALGLLELSLGRPHEADAQLAPLTNETLAAGVGEPGAMRFLPDAIEALIGVGRLDDAEGLLAFYEERAQATKRGSALASAGRCRGLLQSAHGDHHSGLAAFSRALTEHERVAIPFDRGRTLLALGAVQRRTKQMRAARESLGQARVVFEQLGARLWMEKADEELGRIGGRIPSHGELTPAERRIAELVSEGWRNKEVAAALFVTTKTVETTLSRIYAKLGIHSRTALARRLADTPFSKV